MLPIKQIRVLTPSTLGLRLNPINHKGLDDPHWMQYPGPKQTNKQTDQSQNLTSNRFQNFLRALQSSVNSLIFKVLQGDFD